MKKRVVFISEKPRAREAKLAQGLVNLGWEVFLLFNHQPNFEIESYFTEAIQESQFKTAYEKAVKLEPLLYHVFSMSMDCYALNFFLKRPGPILFDPNDIFAEGFIDMVPHLYKIQRWCIENADGLVARDLKTREVKKRNGYGLPEKIIHFPEYCWRQRSRAEMVKQKQDIHVVLVGMFTLPGSGYPEAEYLDIVKALVEQQIHFHVFVHWFYANLEPRQFKKLFADYLALAETGYVHMNPCVPMTDLFGELIKYDFGIISSGCAELGQPMDKMSAPYLGSSYSGRIADYIEAGLPILVNREMRLNFQLLKRMNLGVDMLDLLKPGLKERLCQFRNDPATIEALFQAQRNFSIENHIPRLAKFYESFA